MTQITKTKQTVKNIDGTFKTIDQILRSQMTVLQYGQFLSTQKKVTV